MVHHTAQVFIEIDVQGVLATEPTQGRHWKLLLQDGLIVLYECTNVNYQPFLQTEQIAILVENGSVYPAKMLLIHVPKLTL